MGIGKLNILRLFGKRAWMGLALAHVITATTLLNLSLLSDVAAHPASNEKSVRVSALKGGEGRISVGAERHINSARGILLRAPAMLSWQPLVTEMNGP